MSTLFEAELPGLPLIHRGKVRDLFAVDPERLLIVATDRISAFDVVMPDPIPEKGEILTRLSNFWFGQTRHIVPNHLLEEDPASVLPPGTEVETYRGRTVLIRRLRPLPIEAIVRGYLAGSGWRDYARTGAIGAIQLPPGLRLAEPLPEPIFTPSSKARPGEHDENLGFDQVVARIGGDLAERVRALSLALYRFAAAHAERRGILIADTKFEFGLDREGGLYLIDELLTPDSSRFWPRDAWRPGENPPSFDKQFLRDWLERIGWNKAPPAPHLPPEVVEGTRARYREALVRLTA
jgi:phosphoribosylaminoimidazole-succinocarboxamide synthase